MLCNKFLAEHVLYINEFGTKSYSAAFGIPSTWEFEQGFSALLSIKTKSRNCLDALGHDFRCATSSFEPRIDQLAEKK